jgi:hypothetical protein
MVGFIEERILGGLRSVPNGTGIFVGLATQDCAALVLGYFRFSLREKERGDQPREKERAEQLREKERANQLREKVQATKFYRLWVGFAGGGLLHSHLWSWL